MFYKQKSIRQFSVYLPDTFILIFNLTDNLENSARYKGVVTENTENILDNNDIDVEYNKNMLDNQEFSPSKIGENDSEEQILNQVIGEFLQ